MYPFSVGVMISNYRMPFKEAVEKAARLKLDGIQLAGTREGHEFYPGVMTKDKIAELKNYLKEKNLILSAVCGEQMLGFFNRETNPQLIENSKRILDMAKELDCNIVTTHIGVIPEDTTAERFKIMQEACYDLATYADSLGSHFAIETGPDKSPILKTFLDSLGSKGVAVNLDPGNLVMCAGDNAVEAVYNLKDYIVHTHAKDGRQLQAEDLEHLYATAAAEQYHGVYIEELRLGEGNVNYPAYLAALKDIGYQGFLTIEREISDAPAEDIAYGAGYLRALIENN